MEATWDRNDFSWLLFVSLRTALESLYHESMGTSEMDYWTAQGYEFSRLQGEAGRRVGGLSRAEQDRAETPRLELGQNSASFQRG